MMKTNLSGLGWQRRRLFACSILLLTGISVASVNAQEQNFTASSGGAGSRYPNPAATAVYPGFPPSYLSQRPVLSAIPPGVPAGSGGNPPTAASTGQTASTGAVDSGWYQAVRPGCRSNAAALMPAGAAALPNVSLPGMQTGNPENLAQPLQPQPASADLQNMQMQSSSGADLQSMQASLANNNLSNNQVENSGIFSTPLTTTQMAAIAQQLGLSPAEVQALQTQLANGALSSDQVEKLAVRFESLGINDSDIASMAQALGLTSQQLEQVKSVLAQNRIQQTQREPSGLGPPPAQSLTPATTQQISPIELRFQQIHNSIHPDDSGPPLPQFGYDYFTTPVSTYAPTANVPVGDDYVVGPGDTLNLLLWGRINQTVQLPVDRDGSVQTEIGPLQVAGMSFVEAKKLLQDQFKKIHDVQADVTMGQLRTIQISVVGAVPCPATYTISALSRVSNALSAAGGIEKTGSLRRVRLIRNRQLIRNIDLYNFLLRGDNSADQRLEQNDVIFVPVIGDIVALSGDVKLPGIYELGQPPENLQQLLKLAGGQTAFSYSERMQIERVEHHERLTAVDLPLNQLAARHFQMNDGDMIKVLPILPVITNVVTLSGNIYRPGQFQWHPGMRVSELVKAGQGPMPHTYFRQALLKRLVGPQKFTHFIQVDLAAALAGGLVNAADLSLKPQDDLVVYTEDKLRPSYLVKATGELNASGTFEFYRGMRVSDLIALAGGLKVSADAENAQLARTEVVDGVTRHLKLQVDLHRALRGAPEFDTPLEPEDWLIVDQAANWHLPWLVKIDGRVLKPGQYAIHENERLSDLLRQCGGLSPDAFERGMVFTRASIKAMQEKDLTEARQRLSAELTQLSLNAPMLASQGGGSGQSPAAGTAMMSTFASLQSLLTTAENQQPEGRLVVSLPGDSSDADSDVILEDGDSIIVPRRPSSVNVLGQVYHPTAMLAQPGMKVSSYLYRAGGATPEGDLHNVMVIRADGSVLTDEGLQKTGKGVLFPLLPRISGGILDYQLAAGDTVYVPENLANIKSLIGLQHTKDLTTIIANSASTLAVFGLLATHL